MSFCSTLNGYLSRHYFGNLLAMMAILLGIIYLFDTVELLRRAGKRDDVPFALVLQMGLFKLPEVGQLLFPFAVLFSALFTFWQLNRRQELVAVRAAGFSIWQFLAPLLGVAVTVGVINITLLNPLGAMLLSQFERFEETYLSDRKNHIALLKEGLWLRQVQDEGQGAHVILHADKMDLAQGEFYDVIALFFDAGDAFMRRIDADQVRLDETAGVWVFEQAVSNRAGDRAPEILPLVALPTALTADELKESFSSPETLSFWALPGFIRTLETTGFDPVSLRIHFQTLLVQPLFFAAMILLAAAVSLRPPRQQGTILLAAAGVAAGFMIFFLSSFLQALGASHQIPVFLAAWSPALITLMLGVTAMLSLEDG